MNPERGMARYGLIRGPDMRAGAVQILWARAAQAVAAEPAKKPSVFILLADDTRTDSIAAHGNLGARTPALDALLVVDSCCRM